MSLRCPSCGSDKVENIVGKHSKNRRCKECRFDGAAGRFEGLSADYAHQIPNQHWRDPSAMTPGEYDN